MKNILITGAAGFIGYHLAKSFIDDKNIRLFLIDDFSRGKNDVYLKELCDRKNVEFYEIDLTNPDDYITLEEHMEHNEIEGFDCIYHLAAVNGTKNFYKYPERVLTVNILSCINLLNWLTYDRCKKIVFTSSCETYYGTINRFSKYEEMIPTNEEIPLTIDDIYNRRCSYAISKITGESLFNVRCIDKKIKYNIVRYHNVYGERMGDTHVIPELIDRIEKSKDELEVYGDQTRSFMYVEDAVRDTRLVGESDFNGEIFNIGVEEETKIYKIAKDLVQLSGKDLKLEMYNAPEGSVSRRCPDMSKFKEYFGRQKYIPFSYGLLKTYIWYKGDR